MKIVQLNDENKLELYVTGYNNPGGSQLDPESIEFYEYISSKLIKFLDATIKKEVNGPWSSEYICLLGKLEISLLYDDMLGMIIRANINQKEVVNTMECIYDFLTEL